MKKLEFFFMVLASPSHFRPKMPFYNKLKSGLSEFVEIKKNLRGLFFHKSLGLKGPHISRYRFGPASTIQWHFDILASF